MLAPHIKKKVDELWNRFWAAGLTNPLVAVEQITYLLFLKRLEDIDLKRQQRGFPSIYFGNETCKWSYIRQEKTNPSHLIDVVFPWLRELDKHFTSASADGTELASLNNRMADAYFQLDPNKGKVLSDAIDAIDQLFARAGEGSAAQDIMGDTFNGSGKSNLLRAVAEVFLALADLRVPPFPVSLIYELGVRGTPNHRTLLLHCPGSRQQASLWLHERFTFDDQNGQEVFDGCIEHLSLKGVPSVPGFSALIAPGNWPLRDSTPPQIALPSAVLAYTTGDLRPWRSVWSRNQDARGVLDSGDNPQDEERPAGWTAAQEAALQVARQYANESTRSAMEGASAETDSFRRPVLLDATLLKCALLAVALPQTFIESANYPLRAEVEAAMAKLRHRDDNKNALQVLLERGGWHHLVSVGFRNRLQTAAWDRKLCETAHDWWLCAGEVIAEPHPIELRRTVLFDLKAGFDAQGLSFCTVGDAMDSCTTQGEALWTLLGGADATAFELFTRLLELNQVGLFDDVLLRLRREPVPEADTVSPGTDIGVLRYEELSDGEQMVLGRMALFHLLEGQRDALLLLDEPETHFNDKWKREIVDIIDEAIGNTANDVLISTHSAIVLSDVFNNEIVMVQKTADGTGVRNVDEPTFATDPSALMMTVFGADDSIGKRAQEFIEDKLRQAAGTQAEIADLDRLIARMGSGFYRSELRTLLNTWRANNA